MDHPRSLTREDPAAKPAAEPGLRVPAGRRSRRPRPPRRVHHLVLLPAQPAEFEFQDEPLLHRGVARRRRGVGMGFSCGARRAGGLGVRERAQSPAGQHDLPDLAFVPVDDLHDPGDLGDVGVRVVEHHDGLVSRRTLDRLIGVYGY